LTELIKQNKILFLLILIGIIMLAVMVTCLVCYVLNRRNQDEDAVKKQELLEQKKNRVHEARRLAAPDGVNPIPLSYLILNDSGRDIYIRSFTIDTLPKRTVFAATFPALFNYDRTHSSVFIEPIGEGKATHMLDNRIVEIETNIISAEKNYDRNQLRKLNAKLAETESWARKIEAGENSFYHVYFLFTIQAESLEQLNQITDTFRSMAKEKQIGISCCYGVQPETYLSGMPLNYRFYAKSGPLKAMGLKKHTMDKLSVASIFNHTQADFYHPHGIILGRNLSTWLPVSFDCYDPSHNGYNMVFSGMTGTGKSATMKILASRYISRHGYRFVVVDSQAKGDRGEYSMLADVQSGNNFQIKANNENIINPFELDIEEEWSEINGDYLVLKLQDKIEDTKSILMTLIQGAKAAADFSTATYLERIVIDIISELYTERKIFDGDVDSLYETGKGIKNGMITSGKVKKGLPIITDFYKKALIREKKNTVKEHVMAYRIILDSLKDRVRELYYCRECLRFYTPDEYKKATEGRCSCGKKIITIKGVKSYYDGQSTIQIRSNARVTNIDISQLPKEERPIARQIALSFVTEQFIKRNATNPRKTECLSVICDEVHENFNSKPALESLDYVARTSRKRLVSLWTATQALKDYDGSRETESLLKQAAAKFVFKQSYQDKQWVQKALNLTNGQVERVLELGGDPGDKKDMNRKGEVCIVDNGKVCFCKVDYLRAAEAVFVETDPRIIQQMYA